MNSEFSHSEERNSSDGTAVDNSVPLARLQHLLIKEKVRISLCTKYLYIRKVIP